jgi:serine/threonine-protein kinase
MLPELVSNDELRERFQREARVTANVVSEHIVDVFDAGVDPATGMPFLVMELLDGEELGRRVERLGPLPPSDVLLYLGQVASAIDKTHGAGTVHRDLKPENLFLTFRDDGSPRVKVLDFGISKVVNEGTAAAHGTKSLGTPLYMAPEQLAAEAVSTQTDLYALTLIAYTLLTGAPYWQDEANTCGSVVAFAVQAMRGPAQPPVARAALHGTTLPAGFDAWFRRGTLRNPRERFGRGSELVRALAEALGQPLPPAAARAVSQDAPIPETTGRGSSVGAASVPLDPWSASQAPRLPRFPMALVGVAAGALIALAASGVYFAMASSKDSEPSAASAEVPAAVAPEIPAVKPPPAIELAVIPSASAPATATVAEPPPKMAPRPAPKPAAKVSPKPVSAPPKPVSAPPKPVSASTASPPKPRYTRD